MKRFLLSTDKLDTVWNSWLSTQVLTSHERTYILGRPFGSSSFGKNKKRKFEDWLFNNGGSIRRINKQFYIEFSDPKQGTYFLLRYT